MLSADSPQEKKKIARHWFINLIKKEAQKLASKELVQHFWNNKGETETAWYDAAKTRVRMNVQISIEELAAVYNFSWQFFEELLEAASNEAENTLISGIVPYEFCFRPAKVKNYMRWFRGYEGNDSGRIFGESLLKSINNFCVAVYPFEINLHHFRWIIIPEKIPAPPPKTPLWENILFLMKGFELRSRKPKTIPIYCDMLIKVKSKSDNR
jgi:hypothetical protein